MSAINGNSPVFPDGIYSDGLTKREWLAGMALQGLLACPTVNEPPHAIAKAALDNADALLAALEKQDQP